MDKNTLMQYYSLPHFNEWVESFAHKCFGDEYIKSNEQRDKTKGPFSDDLDTPLTTDKLECHEVQPIPPDVFPDELTDEEWNWDVPSGDNVKTK